MLLSPSAWGAWVLAWLPENSVYPFVVCTFTCINTCLLLGYVGFRPLHICMIDIDFVVKKTVCWPKVFTDNRTTLKY